VFALSPATNLALLAYVPVNLLAAVSAPPSYAIAQGLAQLRMRALASAIMLFVINLIGLGLGPQAVGLLNDGLGARFGAEAIRWSLCTVALANVWAAGHFAWAARTLRRDLAYRPTRSAAA
jgi:hypothetical protein